MFRSLVLALMTSFFISGCASIFMSGELETVAASKEQWTGIAFSQSGRMFVNYPYWGSHVPVSVAEIVDGKAVPYPSEKWNDRNGKESFYAVQSVFIDAKNRLWVLDTNNKQFSGVREPGPVLYQFGLKNDKMVKAYTFPDCYHVKSYFNDVRIDTEMEYAYVTDSGIGAIIVLDLKSGTARRLLEKDSSVKHETDHLMCEGIKWVNKVDSDGIALSPDRKYLYYTALSGHTLYRISTDALRDVRLSEKKLASKVEKVAEIPATDGMLFDRKGNLYLGGLETNSVNVLREDGMIYELARSAEIRWADSFALDPSERYLYFTTSQIYLPAEKRSEYEILKIDLKDLEGHPLVKPVR